MSAVDPITFEVIRNALVAATDEMVLALKRSAYSTNIKTRSDFSCAFFDPELRTVAQAFTQPVHLGSMVQQVPHAIRRYGPENLGPGDAIVTNDPHPRGVHLNDVSLISPVYVDGELLGYVANLAHHVDVGGGAPASIGAFQEVFQEGVIIPPVKVVEGGKIVDDVFRLILAQIRSKHETAGDFRAQIAANATGVRRMDALTRRHGRDTLVATMQELLAYTERRVRAEIAQLPTGTFEAEGEVDNDGYTDEPVRLRVRIEITPDGLHFDTTGSDPQRRAPVNSTYAMTFSACAYALKVLIDPDLPVNDGFYRVFTLEAPEGSVTNCTWPSAVVGGWETKARLVEVMFKALVETFPQRIPAGTKGMMCQAGFGSLDVAKGTLHVLLRGARRRLRRPPCERRPRRRAGERPEHRERADRGDGAQLPGPDHAALARRGLRRAGPLSGRARAAQGLHRPPADHVHDPRRPRPQRPLGGVRRARRGRRPLRADPRRRRDAARLEEHDRPARRRHGQRAQLRRRRLRPARGARPRARPARRAGGEGERGARPGRVPRRGRRPARGRGGNQRIERSRMSVRLAIDIGGTFTDATLIDEQTGEVSIAKVLTTPSDPSEGFMQAAERALQEGKVEAGEVTFVVHATTVATNAIIEGKIARSGFVTTEGFRDLLEIQRQVRPTLYDTQFEKARPLVPRDRAVVVGERLGPKGEVLRPLEDESVREAAAILRREEVESVAVCLLHAYVNPEHERRVGEILEHELPGVPISLSSDVAPEIREYLRASTTVINTVIRPVVQRYLQRIEGRLAEAGVQAKLLVMQSSGGIFGSDAAARRPVFMVESGPGGGRDRLRLPRRDARAAGHPLVRHGRHDGQGRPDPGRPPLGDEGLQRRRACGRGDRRHVALRLPGAHAGRRPRRDRRRAAARSPGSTRAACCASGRRAPAPTRGRSVTGAAASSRP